jgi:hypothetical protein
MTLVGVATAGDKSKKRRRPELPKRIRLSRKKGYRKPPDAVTVSRPTKWGNPFDWRNYIFAPTEHEAKQLAVDDFRDWLAGKDGQYYIEQRQWILDHLHELRDKDVACWCRLDGPCHGDVYLELANK